jgi:hypothetical protein
LFATFTAHAHTGTLLIIATLTEPVLAEPKTHRIDTADLHGEVTISYGWDEDTQINTMRRAWLLDDGMCSEDHVRRRVINPEKLCAGLQTRDNNWAIRDTINGQNLSLVAQRLPFVRVA